MNVFPCHDQIYGVRPYFCAWNAFSNSQISPEKSEIWYDDSTWPDNGKIDYSVAAFCVESLAMNQISVPWKTPEFLTSRVFDMFL